MPRCRCWPIRVWMDTQLNSAVRSRPSTRVCRSDFSPSGRGPQRLCRYRGRKRDRSTSRRQESARIRRSSTSSRPARRPTLELPPLLRSELSCLDANPVRFDDGLSRADCARGRFGSPPPNWVSGLWLAQTAETITVEGPNYVSESRGRAGKRQGQSLPVSPLRTAAIPLAGVELQSLASSVVGGVRRFQLADTGLLSQNLHRPDDGAGQARSRIVIDAGPPHDHRQLMDSSGGWVVE